MLEAFATGTSSASSGNTGDLETRPMKKRRQIVYTQSSLNTAMIKWCAGIKKALDLFSLLQKQLSDFDTDQVARCLGHQISLVLHVASNDDMLSLDFISWVPPYEALSGRAVRLDEDNCVVYPSHFTYEKKRYKPCVMVVPETGSRLRKKEREAMSMDMIQIKHMFEYAIDSIAGSSLLTLDANTPCVVCGSSESLEASNCDLRWCSMCSLGWHTDCASQAVCHVANTMISRDVPSFVDAGLQAESTPFFLWCRPKCMGSEHMT